MTADQFDLFSHPAAPAPPGGLPPETAVLPASDEESIDLHLFAERAYLTYAMSTVLDRALPFVEDGQKPVQRRILFAMREMGNRADLPFKKSARIVGDVIGKYHPHGDSAVYEAAVRMTQDFTLRYPLIEGQGNFGSRDGDSAAAMRYTEVRLSKFAEDILLSEIDRGTVDFKENYDGTLTEPSLLPARLPVLLLNGVSGIAVGMATEIPPHNLREVVAACMVVIANPLDATSNDAAIYAAIPGPDFPGGGHIISSPEDIRKAYESGRGSLRIRARWTVELLARGQYRLAITELPPGTSTAKILAEIEDLVNPKVKTGKKTLSPEQVQLKNAVLNVLDTFRDDSDQTHPVRIVIEPKSRTVTAEELINVLLANTSLESNASINMTMIGRDGRPQQKNLPQTIREWCDYRMVVVGRRLQHRFNEVERRMHILEGRMIALLSIEAVIRVIREADDPKADLIAAFKLSVIQAEDILEIRLRQLARLEGFRIEKELNELRAEADSLRHLLGDETARRTLVVEELQKDLAKYGDDRRTFIEAAEKITAGKIDATTDEPITIILSKNGFIRSRTGHNIDAAMLSWKDGDSLLAITETRTIHPVILFDQTGRAYTVRTLDLPGGKGDGIPVSSLLDMQSPAGKTSRIVGFVSAAPTQQVLLASSAGVGFISKIADMMARNRAGKAFMNIDEGAYLLPPSLVAADAAFIAAVADEPRLLIFPIAEMKHLSGGKGVILISLTDTEHLLAAHAFTDTLTLLGSARGNKDSSLDIPPRERDTYLAKRAKKGKALPKLKTVTQLRG